MAKEQPVISRKIQNHRREWIDVPVNATPDEIRAIRMVGSIHNKGEE